MRLTRVLVVLGAALALVVAAPASAATTTVVVTPTSLAGWAIAPDGTVPYGFVSGTAALGSGSFQFGPIDGTAPANKMILVSPVSDVPVSSVTSFSYEFYVDPASVGGAADAQHLYANVYVDDATNGLGTYSSGFYDCRYDLVPGPATLGVWTTSSFDQSSAWTNVTGSCGPTLGAVPAGSKILAIVLNGGQSTASDAGLMGGFDEVVVTTLTDTTTYDFEPSGACATSTSGTTITLLADCTVTSSFVVPNGFTLDGDGNTITAVDPSGGHFLGAVVRNGGTVAHVTDLEVTASGLADVCDGGADRLRGILFDSGGGSITDVNVHGVRQGLSGCQEGNAIEVRNVDALAATKFAVTISGNTVSDYQKNGITANGNVAATIRDNTITGDGAVTYIAQNGIQIGFGATGLVRGNSVSGNAYSPSDFVACGLLFVDAGGVKQQSNTLTANERNLCNFGRGGGNFNPAS